MGMVWDLIDSLFRVIGIILALGVAFSVLATGLGVVAVVFSSLWDRGVIGKILALPVSGFAFGIWIFSAWRIARYMGGYIGSSEYPFHFVIRWFS